MKELTDVINPTKQINTCLKSTMKTLDRCTPYDEFAINYVPSRLRALRALIFTRLNYVPFAPYSCGFKRDKVSY